MAEIPDNSGITFRRRFLTQIETLFVKVLTLAREMNLLKLGHIALDGTKIDAHANKIESQLRREVQALLSLAEQSDGAAVPDRMDVAAEIARREDRLSAIEQTKRRVQGEAGKKPRGKEPEAPQAGPKDSDQVNLTDEESHTSQ